MQVDPAKFQHFLDSISFRLNGDDYERAWGHLLSPHFPNCEQFWRVFVTPLTDRIKDYPDGPALTIACRQGMSAELEDAAATHYSMFLNLLYAHQHLDGGTICALEDFYAHLASACDLAEVVLEKCYLLVLKCKGAQSKVLQGLTRDEFLERAGEVYDKSYQTLYDYYVKKGKFVSIEIPARTSLLHEFVNIYLGQPAAWKKYARSSQLIRQFRNTIIHDVQIGKVKVGQDTFMPKLEFINKYRTWRAVFSVADRTTLTKEFVQPQVWLPCELKNLETTLNEIWSFLITEFQKEFYSKERSMLRELFQIDINS